MHASRMQTLVSLTLAALFLAGCGLLEPFADAIATACEQEQFVVTKTEDTNDGICTPEDCSLREAVITANACPGTDTIVLSPGTYVLAIEGANEDDAATGDLDISDNLVIEGHGAVIDGNQADRILDIQGQAEGEQLVFVASDLILQNGNAQQGGAIRNAGLAQFGSTTVSNNRAQRGGALYNTGLLTISGAITGNQASEASPGALNAGSLEIRDSLVSGNRME